MLRLKTIESLEHTVGAQAQLVRKLKTFNNKRNKSSYDVSGVISNQELAAMVELASKLADDVIRWLQKSHPELLKGQLAN